MASNNQKFMVQITTIPEEEGSTSSISGYHDWKQHVGAVGLTPAQHFAQGGLGETIRGGDPEFLRCVSLDTYRSPSGQRNSTFIDRQFSMPEMRDLNESTLTASRIELTMPDKGAEKVDNASSIGERLEDVEPPETPDSVSTPNDKPVGKVTPSQRSTSSKASTPMAINNNDIIQQLQFSSNSSFVSAASRTSSKKSNASKPKPYNFCSIDERHILTKESDRNAGNMSLRSSQSLHNS